jgi:hypothetical protein
VDAAIATAFDCGPVWLVLAASRAAPRYPFCIVKSYFTPSLL